MLASLQRAITPAGRRFLFSLAVITLIAGASAFSTTRMIGDYGHRVDVLQANVEQYTLFSQLSRRFREWRDLTRLNRGDAATGLALHQVEGDLRDALQAMRRRHAVLADHYRHDAAVQPIAVFYHAEPYQLAERVPALLDEIAVALDEATPNAARHAIGPSLAVGGLIETGLREAKSGYVDFVRWHTMSQQRQHSFLTTTTLGAILLSGLLVGWPMLRRLQRTEQAAEVSQARLTQLTLFDPVTGCANRNTCHQLIDWLIKDRETTRQPFGLLFVDLNHFRDINNRYGHEAGDHALRIGAERLAGVVGNKQLVARVGADEFVAVLPRLKGPEDMAFFAHQATSMLRTPSAWRDGIDLPLRSSVGAVSFPLDGTDSQTLLTNASLAIDAAKTRYRDAGWCLYRSAIRAEVEAKRALEDELRRAIDARQFVMFFQPKIGIEGKRHIGFEALIRWQHPQKGLLSPGVFLPVAETTGLIVPITTIVLETVVGQLRAWLDAGLDPGHVAVNLPEAVLRDPEIVAQLDALLAKAQLGADRLEIEVTENVFLADNSTVILDNLRRIEARGLRIALDDFGTGYASLSHLRALPFDTLKIDRSFVSDLGQSDSSAAIVRAVINMARSLDKRVIAEGVETIEQEDHLRLEGCPMAQGYLYARPLPPDDATGYLGARAVAATAPVDDGDALMETL